VSNEGELDPKDYVAALDVLKKIDFFQGVAEDTLKSLLFSIQKETIPANKTILFQGEIANRLCIIQAGCVDITTKNKGTRIVLAELTPPSYFGEISLLRPISATATVTAGEEGAQLLIISHDVMSAINKKIPDIETRIQKVIETRLASKKQARDAEEGG
jgi:CRP-like cAMP-binding protein